MSGFSRRDVLRGGVAAAAIGATATLIAPGQAFATRVHRRRRVAPLTYGTTLVGQSYDSYKHLQGAASYNAIENDLWTTVGGTTRYGSAVARRYSPGAIGTWGGTTMKDVRPGQPIIYSFKGSNGQSETQFKTDVRAWLNSKPNGSAHCWLVYFHECDDDIRLGNKGIPGNSKADRLSWWQTRQHWVRDVLNESNQQRSDVSFGPIYTGVPFSPGPAEDHWQNYYQGMETTWDFMGVDQYNPAWDGANRYMPIANWVSPMTNMADATGLKWLVGETGTPLAQITNGLTIAQQNAERAQWAGGIVDAATASGSCEAICWWRRQALAGFDSPFSSIMFTPPGFNSAEDAANGNGPKGGTDALKIVRMWSDKAHASIEAANQPIPFN